MRKGPQKLKKKGYYAEKIAASQTEQRIQFEESERIRNLGKDKKIKKTARQIARQARERKKAYILLLQKQISQLKKGNEELKKTISTLEEENELLKLNKKFEQHNFQGLIPEFQQLFRVLEMQSRIQISRSLSILRDKYGIAGRERAKAINKEFDKILEMSFPMHFRLLMQNCEDNHKFYSLLGINNSIKQFIRLGEKQKEILVKMRPKIIQHKQLYDNIISDLYKIKIRFDNVNRECQNTVDKIEDQLTPQFVGRLLIDLDFYRSKQKLDFIYPINFWQNINAHGISSHKQLQMKMYDEQMSIKPYDNTDFLNDLEIFDSLFN